MVVNFTLYNHGSYLYLPQQTQFYGYPKKTASDDDYLDFAIVNGTAHAVTLSSSGSLTYTTYYGTTYVSNRTFSGSRSFYLSNQTTRLRVYGDDSTIFQFKITNAQAYPSSSGSGSYYEYEALIIPVDSQNYNAIVAESLTIPINDFIVFENVVTSFSVEANNVKVEKQNLKLVFYEDEIYAEDEVTEDRQIIGGRYRQEFYNSYTDYVDFNNTFSLLSDNYLVDKDGDGYPLVEITYLDVAIANGTIPQYQYLFNSTTYFSNADVDDNEPLIPVSYKDLDSDSIGNEVEVFKYGTDPSTVDTDGDELGDGAEASYWNTLLLDVFGNEPPWWMGIYHSNLTSDKEKREIFKANGDLDYDGLTNILDPDADGDGLLDGWEYNGIEVWLHGDIEEYFLPPYLPDFDHDGVSDGNEIWGFFTLMRVPSQYVMEGEFYDETSEIGADLLMRRSAVLSLPSHYLRTEFTVDEPGYYRVKLLTREYGDNPTQTESGLYDNLLNITVYEYDEYSPIEDEEYNFSFVYNISGNSVNANLSMDDLNLMGSRSSVYNLTTGTHVVDISFADSYDSIDQKYLIVVDDILIQQQGLDPTEPDYDDDGLGDGNMTLIGQTVYFLGEESYGSFPSCNDSDNDGLLDGEEINVGDLANFSKFTDPINMDSDYDGLIDGSQMTINKTLSPQVFNVFFKRNLYNETTDNVSYNFYGEGNFGTNATNADTDGDGLLDGKTIYVVHSSDRYWSWIDTVLGYGCDVNFTTYKVFFTFENGNWVSLDPITNDPFHNYTFSIGAHRFIGEDEVGTNATNIDSDNDTLPDGWEYKYNLNPLSGAGDNGSNGNLDGDGAINILEYSYQKPQGQTSIYWGGTDPTDEDTDGDAVLDGNSIFINVSDDNYNAFANNIVYIEYSSNNTRLFYGEDSNSTDAKDFDSDNDGLPDGWELHYKFSAIDNGSQEVINGPQGDPDYDGVVNIHEYNYHRSYYQRTSYWGGLSPQDPDSDDDGLIDGYLMVLDFTDSANDTAVAYLNASDVIATLADKNITYYGEYYFGAKPMVVDTDGDGLLDGHNLTFTDSDSEYDDWDDIISYVDNGGERTYLGEWNLSTDPMSLDSDGDYWLDGENITVLNTDSRYDDWEYLINYTDNVQGDPANSRRYFGDLGMLSSPTLWDTDGDGFSDSVEYFYQMKYTNVDSDGDYLPDSVEPLWDVDMDNENDGINVLDTDSNDDDENDGDEVFVLFRTTSLEYDDLIAIFIDDAPDWWDHDEISVNETLTKFIFKYNDSGIPDGADLIYFDGKPLLTPEDYLLYWDDNGDNSVSIYLDNGTLNGTKRFNESNSPAISNSVELDANTASYALEFKQTYDWIDYLDTDIDVDGIPNNLEGNDDSWDITINGITYTVETDEDDKDSDNDGLIDGKDILLDIYSTEFSQWKTLYNYTVEGKLARFYGEASYGSLPGDASAPTTITNTFDSDNDGLLDGANRSFGSGASEYESWKTAGIQHTQYSNSRVFWGEMNFSTNPMEDDTDGDGLSDLFELIINEEEDNDYLTDPLSNDTDGDGIDDNDEIDGIVGLMGTYETDPSRWDTDNDNISDYDEIYGWKIIVIKPDGTVENRTAYGNPTKYYSRTSNGLNDGIHLNDSVLKEYGGNPLATNMDTDGDGIADEDEIDLSDEDDTAIVIQEITPPEFNKITFQTIVEYKTYTIDLGWLGSKSVTVPVDVYLEVEAWVHDLGGIKAVDIRINSPNRMDWAHSTQTGEYEDIDGKRYYLYRSTFDMNLGTIFIGAMYEFKGEVRAWDIADNYNQTEAKQDGVLKKLVQAVISVLKSTYAIAAAAVMYAVNLYLELIKWEIQFLVDTVILPVIDAVKDTVFNIFSIISDLFVIINNFADVDEETEQNVIDNLMIGFYSIFIDFLSPFTSILEDVKILIDVISTVMLLVKVFSAFINPMSALQLILEILGGVVPAINDFFGMLFNVADGVINTIIEKIFSLIFSSENSICSILNIFDIEFDFGDFPVVTWDSIINFIEYSGIILGPGILLIVDIVTEIIEDGKSAVGDFFTVIGAIVCGIIMVGMWIQLVPFDLVGLIIEGLGLMCSIFSIKFGDIFSVLGFLITSSGYFFTVFNDVLGIIPILNSFIQSFLKILPGINFNTFLNMVRMNNPLNKHRGVHSHYDSKEQRRVWSPELVMGVGTGEMIIALLSLL